MTPHPSRTDLAALTVAHTIAYTHPPMTTTACVICGGPALSRGGQYCGPTCTKRGQRQRRIGAASERPCATCKQPFRPYLDNAKRGRGSGEYCSRQCAGEARRTKPLASRIYITDCSGCGRTAVRRRSGSWSCPDCASAARSRAMLAYYHSLKGPDGRTPPSWRKQVDRRSRRLRDQYIEDVLIDDLATRDHYRCHICRRRVNMTKPWPDPMSASIDHLIPISDGGEHSYRNTALAHLRCNLRKHNRATNEQLRLIG